jgi:NAD-dependent oxidoreductase involved in siderophore biosynthesis
MVGQARYIDDPVSYFWDIVLDSHAFVDDVLTIEKELSQTFSESEQYCFEERLSTVVRTQCAEYAAAYQERMQGMVEARMQDAILSVGSAWFTAWVDGGQPEFRDFVNEMSDADKKAFEELERAFIKGNSFGREH